MKQQFAIACLLGRLFHINEFLYAKKTLISLLKETIEFYGEEAQSTLAVFLFLSFKDCLFEGKFK